MVDGTEEMTKPGPPGELKVWIGDPSYQPTPEPGMARSEGDVPASGQKTVRADPTSTGLTFEPAHGPCMKLDPQGTTVTYFMKPRDTGEFNVRVAVNLFDSPDCSGTPTPREAKVLVVRVKIGVGEGVLAALETMGSTLWQEFLKFWHWLVALLFGVVSAVVFTWVRRKLKSRGIHVKNPDGSPG